MPPSDHSDEDNAGVTRYNPYPDLAKQEKDKSKVYFLQRDAEPGNGRRPDRFLADAPLQLVTPDNFRVEILAKILETCRKDEPGKKVRQAIDEALLYLKGKAPLPYRLGYLPGLLQDEPVDVDARCERCLQRGQPCIVRVYEDENGKLQIFHTWVKGEGATANGSCFCCCLTSSKCNLRVLGPLRRNDVYRNEAQARDGITTAKVSSQALAGLARKDDAMADVYKLAQDKTDEILERSQQRTIRSPKKKRLNPESVADLGMTTPKLARNINTDRTPRKAWYPLPTFGSGDLGGLPYETMVMAARGSKPTNGLVAPRHPRWAPLAKIESYGDEVSCQSLFVQVQRPPKNGSYLVEEDRSATGFRAPIVPLADLAKDLSAVGMLRIALLKKMKYPNKDIEALRNQYPDLK